MLAGGLIMGLILGFGVAQMLVKVLTGVFDPPPEALSVPWPYLGVLLIAASVSTGTAVLVMQFASKRTGVEGLRDI